MAAVENGAEAFMAASDVAPRLPFAPLPLDTGNGRSLPLLVLRWRNKAVAYTKKKKHQKNLINCT
jgi:hypothetical protein